jgi:hypothetical protein
MSSNPLRDSFSGVSRKSPKDPFACAIWANQLLTADQAEIMQWDVVEGRVRLRRLPSGELVGSPPFKNAA